jgi:lipoyl(octanoyl) transferase
MHSLTEHRTHLCADEVWLVQHPAVFTQGQAGKPEHLLLSTDIPVVQSDRGGQITYHGLGQQIMYTMIDLRRRKLGVRQLVSILEQSVINTLADLNIEAYAKTEAPGVYVNHCKIASLGLRIRNGRSFHGVALNVDMDLQPFGYINPCGYAGLQMTQIKDFIADISLAEVQSALLLHFIQLMNYSCSELKDWRVTDYD